MTKKVQDLQIGDPGRQQRAEDVAVAPGTETIYQAVDAGALGVKATEWLRSRRPRRRGRQARHTGRRSNAPT